MTAPTLDAEPACHGSSALSSGLAAQPDPTVRAERRAFGDIAPETWDALAARTPWSTPFASWAFHRAWWDAYGDNAHQETLVIVPSGAAAGSEPIAIVPLMHRHEVEATDALTHTRMRHGAEFELTPVPSTAKAIFFGASYHADYATILADPGQLPAVASAVAAYLAGPDCGDWDVVDLRRLRCGDPAADALAAALGAVEMANDWTLNVEREDVCPVVRLPADADLDGYLATLDKKERHEIRRKVRRAQAVGEVRLEDVPEPLAGLEDFIDLHQKRWGDEGLFPPTAGGDQSRVFFRRLFELFGSAGPLRLTFLTVGGRRIAAGIHFQTADTVLYYNAGVDPEARDLSPGVVMVHAYLERALGEGKRRLDFLRGDESYKYDWGALDEPIQRLLVRRKV
ncbi:MAG: GNAT family N-acetyltransferase [Chloroflexi bacterium]|nr:GNAT family N-acetyltransferase [Chloroflexota bacterium]